MSHKLSFLNLLIVVALLLTGLFSTASAANNRLVLITQGWDGSQADGGSFSPAISADGRYVVFNSQAANLIKDGLPNQLYLYDQKTGTMELVSRASDGSPVNSEVYNPAISGDGRFIAFGSSATNLAGDLPGEVYVRDRQTGETVLVSGPPDGSLPDADANSPSISATGRYIAFVSFSDNLLGEDIDILPDIYVRDMENNQLYLASISSSGEKANSDSGVAGGPSISGDGRYVAFQSYASNLVPGDTNEASDVFVHDLVTGKTERISVSSNGKQANDRSEGPAISGNGRFVGFISWASNLVAGDTNGAADIFVRDLLTGKTERVSVSAKGVQSAFSTIYDAGNFARVSLSYDGRFITFASQAASFEKTVNINACNYEAFGGGIEPCANIYLHDRKTGKTSLISRTEKNQSGNTFSYSPVISQDGNWIAFASDASNLLRGDANGQADIFLYRH